MLKCFYHELFGKLVSVNVCHHFYEVLGENGATNTYFPCKNHLSLENIRGLIMLVILEARSDVVSSLDSDDAYILLTLS